MTEEVSFNDWKKVDLKVGEIKSVEDHPNADKLLVMKVDIGEERTIVAGLKNHYSAEDLIGKKVIIFTNLEQKELRGVKSEGMVLAVVKDDKVVLIEPGNDIGVGAKVE